MQFINLTSLIDGKLLNEPSILSFSNISFDAKKIKIGELYIGDDDIELAIKNGAYGIVSESFKITDNEIAWIKVDDLESAKLKLLRYLVLKSSKDYFFLSPVEYEIFKQIVEQKEFFFIKDDIQKAIIEIFKKDKSNTIIFLNENIYNKLSLEKKRVDILEKIDVRKNTIFLTSFTYKGRLYKDFKLPRLFVDKLESLLNLLDFYNFEYQLQRLNFITHFKPIFIDKNFKIVSFGNSSKVVILENKKDFLNQEIKYLKKNAPWAKILLILPSSIKDFKKEDIDIYYYESYEDIFKKNIFYYNYAIMFDSKNGFEEFLSYKNSNIKDTLF